MKTGFVRTSALASVLLAALFVFSSKPAHAATVTSNSTGGNWSSTGTWAGGAVPAAGDDVVISTTGTNQVTLNASPTVASLTVNSGAILTFGSGTTIRTLIVSGAVTNTGTIQPYNPISPTTYNLRVGGNFTNNGTFTSVNGNGSIDVLLNGTSAQSIGGSSTTTFSNLTLSNTAATIGATTNFNVNGTMTVSANVVFGPDPGVVIGGTGNTITGNGTVRVTRIAATADYTSQYGFGTSTLTNLTVDYAGTAAQTVSAQSYGNLRISNTSAAVTAGTNFNVSGTMTVNSGAVFSPAAGVVINSGAAAGTITGSGTIQVTRIAATADYSSQYLFSSNTLSSMTVDYAGAGNQTINARTYGSLTTSGSGTKTPDGALTVNNILTVGAGTILDESTRTMTVSASVVVSGTLDFTSSTGLIRTGTSGTTTLTMAPNGLIRTADDNGLGPATNASLQAQGTGIWNTSSIDTNGTVEYYRSTSSGQTVTDRDYNNLTISGTTQTKTWTLGGTRTVNGNLTISSGAPFALSGAQTLNVVGNWTNNGGTFTPGTSTVTFNGGGTSTLSLAATGGTETFCNLTISAGTLLDTTDDFVAVVGSGNCTLLTDNGQLRREAPALDVTGAGPYYFNDSWNLNGVVLTRTTTGNSDLGSSTTMTVTSNLQPTTCGSKTLGGQPVLRLYDIHPSNSSPYNQYTLRLYFRASNPNESNGNTAPYNLAIYHCDGTNWTRLPGTGGSDSNGVYVEVTGVNSFSLFAIGGGPGAPTAVTFSNMSAQPSPDPLIPVLTGIGVLLLLSIGGLLTWKRFKAT